jgi:hypothetical protein
VAEYDEITPYRPPADEPQHTTQSVQAAVEGAPETGDVIAFMGEKFRIAESVGAMPMLAFAKASKSGLDTEDMAGMAAMYSMIRDVIHRPKLYDEHGNRVVDEVTGKPAHDESEWRRFEELATDEQADGEELMTFVSEAMAVISARPPKRRGISSASSPTTSPRSKGSSSSPVTHPQIDGLTDVRDIGRDR